jgi:aminoacrylate hydrolase
VYFEIHGRLEADAPTVLLSSGLGGAAQYWAPQIPVLAERFRVIAYDHQGTGGSPGNLPEGYAVADMAREAGALLDELGVGRCAFIGHALGGLIGLRLAHDRPALVERLVLVNAWVKTHPHTARCFAARTSLLRQSGAEAFVRAQPLFLYPADWLASRQDWLAAQDAAGIEHFPGMETVLRRIDAILAFDMSVSALSIATPAHLIASRDDVLVPSGCSVTLAEVLGEADVTMMERGGHACNVTEPEAFNGVMMARLSGG